MKRTLRSIAAAAVAAAVWIAGPVGAHETGTRWEQRVPVCAEDERALGVGDYTGSEGWARWECVHIDELRDQL